jgi:enterochelin esterase family protein
LNPHHWFENPGSTKFEYQSIVEMPDAKPQPYIAKRAGVPAGSVEKKRIKSALLKNERDLSIYTPPGYRRDAQPNGLLVVFDEGSYLTLVPTPVILDNLLFEKKIPPMVAVLIANPDQETRTREVPPNPDFADFLNNELIPWVRGNYNVAKDPGRGSGCRIELWGDRFRVRRISPSRDVRKHFVSIRFILVISAIPAGNVIDVSLPFFVDSS